MLKVASDLRGGEGDGVEYAVVCGCGLERCW